MKKLVLVLMLGLFASSIAFADILPPNSKVVTTTLKVQGLNYNGKTVNGSILVLVVDTVQQERIVTRVYNNQLIDKGYKFNTARLFFVSAALLSQMSNNINNIDFSKKYVGLTVAPIEVPGQLIVDKNSPVNNRSIVYTVK